MVTFLSVRFIPLKRYPALCRFLSIACRAVLSGFMRVHYFCKGYPATPEPDGNADNVCMAMNRAPIAGRRVFSRVLLLRFNRQERPLHRRICLRGGLTALTGAMLPETAPVRHWQSGREQTPRPDWRRSGCCQTIRPTYALFSLYRPSP